MFTGMNLAFGPQHWVGMDGMPRSIYTYPANMGWDFWNLMSTIGAFIIGVSILVFLYNIYRSFSHGEPAGADPWDARTLEWSMPSPPPLYNFARIPTVHGRDAFWDQKYATDESGRAHRLPAGAQEHAGHGEEVRNIHIPDPSYFPIFVALGLALAALGIAFHPAISLVGVALFLISIYGWAFEPTVEPRAQH
jgi:cytochrome c oxidase subunit 1